MSEVNLPRELLRKVERGMVADGIIPADFTGQVVISVDLAAQTAVVDVIDEDGTSRRYNRSF